MSKSIVVVGMGPGLSLGVARKFGLEGFRVGMVSRNPANLNAFRTSLEEEGIEALYAAADVTDEFQTEHALHNLAERLGGVDVLHYNAVAYKYRHILDETAAALANDFKTSVGNALTAVKAYLPMLQEKEGAVLLTGGGTALNPYAEMGAISLGKAGIRSLAYMLHHSLKDRGVYVGTLTVNGAIAADSPTHSPDALGEQFWKLYLDRKDPEVIY